jgi:hypothetical protein
MARTLLYVVQYIDTDIKADIRTLTRKNSDVTSRYICRTVLKPKGAESCSKILILYTDLN